LDAFRKAENIGQIFMTWKFIEFPAEMKVEDQIMTDMEFQMFMRRLSQTRGVNLMTAPPVITLNGHQVGFQSALEVHSMTEEGEALTDFNGIRGAATPAYKGEVMFMEGTVDIGTPEGAVVRHSMVDFSATLQDGQTAVILFPSQQSGGQIMAAAVTAKSVYAAGQPQEEQSGALPDPPPADPVAGDPPDK
jgi:hypothetical protein